MSAGPWHVARMSWWGGKTEPDAYGVGSGRMNGKKCSLEGSQTHMLACVV